MKTARAPVPESSSASSRRSQPLRQTRTNPPRTAVGLNRTNSLTGTSAPEQPIDIFPAVTHFTDAITALPKELVRHFTLLKEVDAKICGPESSLFKLIDIALDDTPSVHPLRITDSAASGAVPPPVVAGGAQNSSGGIVTHGQVSIVPAADVQANSPPGYDRSQILRQAALMIHEMLVSLEEKNHVISTANEALHRQLGRIEDVWPHLQNEFSDEAKWGSTTHWAYLENRIAKANHTQAERSRREGAATLSAAAQQLAEEAAARSSDRKQALAAKKNSKNQNAEAEQEGRPEPVKKSHSSNKPRASKPSEPAANVGLGITNGTPTNGATAPVKPPRKKPEAKAASSNGAATERAMSNVFAGNTPKQKPASPRETPAPDGQASKKRKALPVSGNQAKKNRTAAGASPSITSSPVIGTFPDANKAGRSSPAPAPAARPTSSRARQNSTHSTFETARQRPSPPDSTKPNSAPAPAPEAAVPSSVARVVPNEAKASVAATLPAVGSEIVKQEVETRPPPPPPAPAAAVNGTVKKETPASKPVEDSEPKAEPAAPASAPAMTPTLVTTKSGRASKPSTPALATFAEAAAARSRPTRTSDAGTAVKRSHKKGASTAAAAAAMLQAQAARQASGTDGEVNGSLHDDDDDEGDADGDEPRYCYCNGVSYGEMVACDADGCPREWFHLECVGLKVAPKGNAKWYCEDCKERLRHGKKINVK